MATVEFDLRGAGKIPAEHDAIADAADKSAKKQEKLGQTWKTVAAEITKYDRMAKDILKRNESDQEKYNRKLAETKKALAGNARETELLAKETTRLRVELLKAQDGNPKLSAQRRRESEEAIANAKREAAEKEKLARASFVTLTSLEKSATQEHKRQVEARITDITRQERAYGKVQTTLRDEIDKLPDLIDPVTAALGEWTMEGESLGKKIKDVETESETAFGNPAVARIGAWAASFASVHTALRVITDEMRAQQELVDKQHARQLTVSETRNVVLRNLGSKSDAEIAEAQKFTRELADETGISEAAINLGLSEAVVATGGNVQAAIDATRMAAKFLPDRPYEMSEYAASLADLSKVTGSFDADVNQGLQGLVGEVGRVVDPRLQARNIPQALINTLPYGGDATTSGSLFGAISNASADYTGSMTGTAVVQLADQLKGFSPGGELAKEVEGATADLKSADRRIADAREHLEEIQLQLQDTDDPATRRVADAQRRLDSARERREKPERIAEREESLRRAEADLQRQREKRVRSQKDAEEDLQEALGERDVASQKLNTATAASASLNKALDGFDSLDLRGRVKRLQENPDLAEKFLAGAHFEAKVKGVVNQLLSDSNSFVAQQYEKNLRMFGDNDELAAAGRQSVEVLGLNPLNVTAQTDRQFESTNEAIDLATVQTSLTTNQLKELDRIQMRTGKSSWGAWTERELAGLGDGAPGLSVKSAIGILDQAYGRTTQRMGPQGWQPKTEAEMTPSDRETAAAIMRLIQQLKIQAALIEEQNKLEFQRKSREDDGGGLIATPG